MENDLPKRKPTRLFGFDYGTPGAYFITICTQNRKNILSTIVGEGSPLPQLTHIGRLVDGVIQSLSQKFSQAVVDCYVIMPNHLHLMLSIHSGNGRGNPSPTVNMIIGWLKYEATKKFNQLQNTIYFSVPSTIILFAIMMIMAKFVNIYTTILPGGDLINFMQQNRRIWQEKRTANPSFFFIRSHPNLQRGYSGTTTKPRQAECRSFASW